MFKRLINWLKGRNRKNQNTIVRTDPDGHTTKVQITPAQCAAIESIMTNGAYFFVIKTKNNKVITLVHNVDYATVLSNLSNIALDRELITPAIADTIEAIMTDGAFFIVVKNQKGRAVTLTHDMDYATVLGELADIARNDKDFKNELTNMVIDINRK